MQVTIDSNSGFCFGVVYAIQQAEEELDVNGHLYCLGDIVHNNMEVDRLKGKGLEIINHEQLQQLHNCKVLIQHIKRQLKTILSLLTHLVLLY